MHVVVVTIDIKPEFVDRFVAAMLANARNSVIHEPNCLRFDVIRDEKNPTRLFLYEAYRDRAAFDVHVTMPHYFVWRDTVKEWFAAPPILGSGPNLFPEDADWGQDWKGR